MPDWDVNGGLTRRGYEVVIKRRDDEIAWLRRQLQWCRARLSKDVYVSALDAALANGPTEPDLTPVVQSES